MMSTQAIQPRMSTLYESLVIPYELTCCSLFGNIIFFKSSCVVGGGSVTFSSGDLGCIVTFTDTLSDVYKV